MAKKRARARVYLEPIGRRNRWHWYAFASLGGPYDVHLGNSHTYARRKDAMRSALRTLDRLGIVIVHTEEI